MLNAEATTGCWQQKLQDFSQQKLHMHMHAYGATAVHQPLISEEQLLPYRALCLLLLLHYSHPLEAC
jgi:hypothetical protein